MPLPITLYKGDRVASNIYPVDLDAWIADGWSTTKYESSAVEEVEGAIVSDSQTQPININTATINELVSLPEIGMAKAKRIQAGRPYKDADDLAAIAGVDWPELLRQGAIAL